MMMAIMMLMFREHGLNVKQAFLKLLPILLIVQNRLLFPVKSTGMDECFYDANTEFNQKLYQKCISRQNKTLSSCSVNSWLIFWSQWNTIIDVKYMWAKVNVFTTDTYM